MLSSIVAIDIFNVDVFMVVAVVVGIVVVAVDTVWFVFFGLAKVVVDTLGVLEL